MPEKSAQSRSRRTFLKLVPATIGAGLALPKRTHARSEQPSPVTKADLEAAERLAGISFNDSEREMMRQNVATNRDHFEALRRVPIGYDVEPAFTFKPYRRPSQNGGSSHERATPHTRLRIDRPRARASTRPSDEGLASIPVASLAG